MTTNADNRENESQIEEKPSQTVIGTYPSAALAHDAGLTILASNDAYWVIPFEDKFLLVVSSTEVERLSNELQLTQSINQHWPPSPFEFPIQRASLWPTIFSLVILIAVFIFQEIHPNITELGLNSKQGILEDNEYWRAITAISLHADLAHLAGNLLGISLFTYFVSRYLGAGLSWFSIIVLSAAANATNAIVSSEANFRSLGASTAVFVALGLFTGVPVGSYFRDRMPILSRDWIVPFFSGCILFTWMGGGDFPTDVTGHLLSFAYGAIGAILISWTGVQSKISKPTNNILLILAFLLFAGSWAWARLI